MNKPNLFIIGAPKCGTTSLATWLGGQDRVFMSFNKEPNFFSTDVRISNRMSQQDYQKLFYGAQPFHSWVGEGSTRYLYSQVACRNILSFCDSPKFIAIVRNPIDMVYSLHNHLSYLGVEQFKDFRKAWNHKDVRARGDMILSNCNDPDSLAYGKIGLLGEQVESFFETVPAPQRLLLQFDDLKSHPELVYQQILNFLDLEEESQNDVVITNKSMKRRVEIIGNMANWLGAAKQKCGIRVNFGVWSMVNKWNRIEKAREPLEEDLRIEMQEYFRSDILKLEKLTGRDLSHWVAR